MSVRPEVQTSSGSCHCGKVRFTVEGSPTEGMECNCSLCQRKGYILWFVPREKLSIQSGGGELSTYRFNRHVIDHHFCPECGCAPFSESQRPDGQPMAAINIRCLENIDLAAIKRIPFDGRSR